jgi:2-methylcitrate dehydratase PrpD
MTKYGVPGWQGTGAVNAALLAEMGYTGDTTVLDDPHHGFAWYTGYPNWWPEEITERLNEDWTFTTGLHYKPYPCCGVFHGALDCFYSLIQEHDLRPAEMERVTAYCRGSMETPPFEGISGAQFNPRYVFSVAAHRVPTGAEWYTPQTMADSDILDFMGRVDCEALPGYRDALTVDPLANPARVEVVARGRTYSEKRAYRHGTVRGAERPSDVELEAKFRHNAEKVLTPGQGQRALEMLCELERLSDVTGLLSALVPSGD